MQTMIFLASVLLNVKSNNLEFVCYNTISWNLQNLRIYIFVWWR